MPRYNLPAQSSFPEHWRLAENGRKRGSLLWVLVMAGWFNCRRFLDVLLALCSTRGTL